ncbi:hypothetical protein PMAYCL1PPCAC_04414, partial [Pristionchus mayeri]
AMMWCLSVLLLLVIASAHCDVTPTTVALEEKVESTQAPEQSEFHARGIQTFKGNSDLAFRLLYVYPIDSKKMGDAYFTFIMLESTSVKTKQTKNPAQPLNYLEVRNTSDITMRLYFNPGNRLVGSLQLEMRVGYMNNGNHTSKQLHFKSESDALLCPKMRRYEFGSCHYRRNTSTFEEINLPTKNWPEGAKKEVMSTVTFVLLEGDKKTPVLGATFYSLFTSKEEKKTDEKKEEKGEKKEDDDEDWIM